MTERITSVGQVVLDDHDNTAMVVVDPDVGTLGTVSDETERIIREAETNDPYHLTDDTELVECVYVSERRAAYSADTYTFPRDRVRVPENSPDATESLDPVVYSKAKMLVDLYKASEISEITSMDAGIDGQVILAAKQILTAESASADWDDVFFEELLNCPVCKSSLELDEGVESDGRGTAEAVVFCQSPDCAWQGVEVWNHCYTEQTEPSDLTEERRADEPETPEP